MAGPAPSRASCSVHACQRASESKRECESVFVRLRLRKMWGAHAAWSVLVGLVMCEFMKIAGAPLCVHYRENAFLGPNMHGCERVIHATNIPLLYPPPPHTHTLPDQLAPPLARASTAAPPPCIACDDVRVQFHGGLDQLHERLADGMGRLHAAQAARAGSGRNRTIPSQ